MKSINALAAILLCLLPVTLSGQTYIAPNYGLKSHETLVIDRIINTEKSTVIYLTVENRREGGVFCADRNTFIIAPDGTRLKLNSSSGIPSCPEAYKFQKVGEKLSFSLTFPSPGKEHGWFDLVEDCTDNCFSFYGITLDDKLNDRLNEILTRIGRDKAVQILPDLIRLAEDIDHANEGIEGFIYVTIILLEREAGNYSGAGNWYRRMLKSSAPSLSRYVNHLNSQGIVY